jgi:antirestriction protein ArdC
MSLEVQGTGSSEGKGSIDWRERKRFLKDKLEELAGDIVTDPDRLRAFAERWRGGFRSYSLHNLILIWIQRSDASLCAGFNQWKRHGRWVRKGEKAIWILAPAIVPVKGREDETEDECEKVVKYFFPVPVFDYSQTDGQALLIGNTRVSGDGVDIQAAAAAFGIPVEYSQGVDDGHTDGKTITISRRDSKAQESATFFHELAHVLLGHLEDRQRGKLTADVRELEAESVSFLVCACLGVDNDGAKFYLGHWKGDRSKLAKSALRILSTAEKILRKVKPEAFGARLEVQSN